MVVGGKTIYNALDLLILEKDKYKNPVMYLWKGFKKELNGLDKYKDIEICYVNGLADNTMTIGDNITFNTDMG